MKLNAKEFAEFKKLSEALAAGKIKPGSKEEKRLAILTAKRASKEDSRAGTNDFDWYNAYPELIRDAANIVFNEIAGTEFDPGFVGGTSSTRDTIKWMLSGVRVNFIPTPGKLDRADAAYNYAMRDLWLTLHRAYRGIGTYEFPDLGIAIFAILAVFCDIARAERTYGAYCYFSTRNRAMPNALLTALGLDANLLDVSARDLANFRYALNRIIAKAQALCLPKGMKIFNQLLTLNSFIYKDGDDVRSQFIIYDNPYVLRYNATKHTTGGCVEYGMRKKSGTSTVPGQTLNDILDDLDSQVDLLLTDTDIARMCSDILKAFGDNGVIGVSPMSEDYKVEPIRDEVRLLQLHNTVFNGCPVGNEIETTALSEMGSFTKTYETLDLYQYQGYMRQVIGSNMSNSGAVEGTSDPSYYGLIAGSTWKNSYLTTVSPQYNWVLGAATLDTWKDKVSDEDIVELTRQSVSLVYGNSSPSGKYWMQPSGYSTYIVISMDLFTGNAISNPNQKYFVGTIGTNFKPVTSISDALDCGYLFGLLSQCDWHPPVGFGRTSGAARVDYMRFWDIQNYTAISSRNLDKIHEACTLSLFKLPTFSGPMKD